MTVIVEDLVDGHELNDVLGGSSIKRTFRISELVAIPSGQLIEAVQDPGIPKIGEPYPVFTTLFVLTVNARPDGPNAARVECNYSVANRDSGGTWNQPYPGLGNDGKDVKQITSGVREVITYRDTSNNVMTLNPPASKTTAQSYGTTASRLTPTGSVVFERTETEPGTGRMRGYVGKVNSPAVGAYGDKTLLFRSYDEQSEDGGTTWNSTYTFDYATTWQHVDVWRDQDGKMPTDGVVQFFDTLETANFNDLALDFTDGQTPL